MTCFVDNCFPLLFFQNGRKRKRVLGCVHVRSMATGCILYSVHAGMAVCVDLYLCILVRLT